MRFRCESGRTMLEVIAVLTLGLLLALGGVYMWRSAEIKTRAQAVIKHLVVMKAQRQSVMATHANDPLYREEIGPYGTPVSIQTGTTADPQKKNYYWINIVSSRQDFRDALKDLAQEQLDPALIQDSNTEITFYFHKFNSASDAGEGSSDTGTGLDNNHCPTHASCDSDDNVIGCEDGYCGTECDDSCGIGVAKCDGDCVPTECDSTHYGENCSNECPTDNVKSCDIHGLECSDGYAPNAQGTACEEIECDENADRNGSSCQCHAGYFGDGRECMECNAGFYSEVGFSYCSSCRGNTYSSSAASSCVPCPTGYVSNNTHTGCDLKSCTRHSDCTASDRSYCDTTTKKCTQCDEDKWFNSNTGSCEDRCSENSDCGDSNLDYCSSNGHCVKCNSGQWYNSASDNCENNCTQHSDCTATDRDYCDTTTSHCVQCPENQWFNSNTGSCEDRCSENSDCGDSKLDYCDADGHCNRCNSNEEYDESTQTCGCPSGQFYSKSGAKVGCVSCDDTGANFVADDEECAKCGDQRVMTITACIIRNDDCDEGYFANDSGVCKRCSESNAIGSTEEECKKCPQRYWYATTNNYQVRKGKCALNKCTSSQFHSFWNNDTKCYDCSTETRSIPATETECAKCGDLREMVDDKCALRCEEGKFRGMIKKGDSASCQSCSDETDYFPDTEEECAKCGDLREMRGEKCVKKCNSDEFWGTVDKNGTYACQSCSDDGEYYSPSEEACKKCPDRRIINGKCVKDCPSNQFWGKMSNETTWACKLCSENGQSGSLYGYYSYDDAECNKCTDAGYEREMVNGKCVIKLTCPAGTFFTDRGECTSCSEVGNYGAASIEDCLRCSNPTRLLATRKNNTPMCNLCPKGQFAVYEAGVNVGCKECSDEAPYATTVEECRKCNTLRYSEWGTCIRDPNLIGVPSCSNLSNYVHTDPNSGGIRCSALCGPCFETKNILKFFRCYENRSVEVDDTPCTSQTNPKVQSITFKCPPGMTVPITLPVGGQVKFTCYSLASGRIAASGLATSDPIQVECGEGFSSDPNSKGWCEWME